MVTGPSRNQAGDEGAEQGFAASARIVHELEEAEVKRQLVLRDAAMRSQPGTQQRPEAFHGVDVDLAKPVPVLVAGILAAGVADGLVECAPGGGQNERFELTPLAGFPEDGIHDKASFAQRRLQAAGC